MISVVIVTYNSEACIQACIEAVIHRLPDAEIIVVDNASSDASCDVARLAGATVFAQENNLGFGRACNVGAQQAINEHILFLNPDVAIGSVDLTRLSELLAADALGLVVPASAEGTFMSTESSWVNETLSLAVRALRPRELPKHSPSRRRGRTLWASGAVLLVRREEFLDVGGFDSRYFLYYEDRDLSWKYRERGLPVRSTRALVADHVGGGSSEVSDRRSNIGAFAVIGWIQYRYSADGHDAAARTWRLLSPTHACVTRVVECAALVAPSTRLRRKSLQLREVTQELERIRRSEGVLEQSDESHYWPGAVAVLSASESRR